MPPLLLNEIFYTKTNVKIIKYSTIAVKDHKHYPQQYHSITDDIPAEVALSYPYITQIDINT